MIAAVAACLLLVACQATIRAEVVVDADGAGNVAVTIDLDEAMMRAADELEFDPTVELAAIASDVEPWQISRSVDEGALHVKLTRPTASMQDVGDAFRELAQGLDEVDPGLIIDVEMRPDDDGAIVVDGNASVRPPASLGWRVDDVEYGPSADELRHLFDDHIDARFRLHMRGDVIEANADDVQPGELAWTIPVGTNRQVAATVQPMASRRTVIWLSVTTMLVALLFTGVALTRRERTSASNVPRPARRL